MGRPKKMCKNSYKLTMGTLTGILQVGPIFELTSRKQDNQWQTRVFKRISKDLPLFLSRSRLTAPRWPAAGQQQQVSQLGCTLRHFCKPDFCFCVVFLFCGFLLIHSNRP